MYNTIFGTVQSERRWIHEMRDAFCKEHVSDIELGVEPCVFRVPRSLIDTKPEAYAPQQLGLGPYHHLKPYLYIKQWQKIATARKLLNPRRPQIFQKVVQMLKQMEPIIRASYNDYLDLDIETLAYILAIDSLYLLSYSDSINRFSFSIARNADDLACKRLFRDIFMLENQIPAFVLKEVRRTVGFLPQNFPDEDQFENYDMFRSFLQLFEQQSPLLFTKEIAVHDDAGQTHLLHRMYHLIVNNRGIKEPDLMLPIHQEDGVILPMDKEYTHQMSKLEAKADMPKKEDFYALAKICGGVMQVVKGLITRRPASIRKVPWGTIAAMIRENNKKDIPLVEEINVPSVSQLCEYAKIKFKPTPGGIRDVQFNAEERTFYLPVIKMHSNSEVILRNLVAYEAASAKPGSILELAEYVDLMCGIVDTSKDVDILRKEHIITGTFPSNEIARVFNMINKTTREKDREESNVEQATETVNKMFGSVKRIKISRFIKKHAKVSWKLLTVLSTILVILIIAVQAFCDVYNCRRLL